MHRHAASMASRWQGGGRGRSSARKGGHRGHYSVLRNRSSGTLLRMRGLEGHGFVQTPRRPWWVPCHWLGRKLKKAVDATPPIVSSIAGISSSRPTMLCDFDSSTSLITRSLFHLIAARLPFCTFLSCFSSAVHTFLPFGPLAEDRTS